MWEVLQVIQLPTGPTTRNIMASGSGMGCLAIKMLISEVVISCNIARRVGGAVGNSNACYSYY